VLRFLSIPARNVSGHCRRARHRREIIFAKHGVERFQVLIKVAQKD